mgnify:CR=1 FL=1
MPAPYPGLRVQDSMRVRHAPAVLLNGELLTMERVTLRIPKQQIEAVERMVESGEFPNRSEAIRAAVREKIKDQGEPVHERTRERTWAKV